MAFPKRDGGVSCRFQVASKNRRAVLNCYPGTRFARMLLDRVRVCDIFGQDVHISNIKQAISSGFTNIVLWMAKECFSPDNTYFTTTEGKGGE